MTRQHGTRARYVIGPDMEDRPGHGCRCDACRAANRDAVRHETRMKLYGRWQPYIDAAPVRAHVETLREYGVGWRRIAQVAGVPTGGMSKLLYGDPKRNMAPSKRVRPETAEKILAVQPSIDLLADGAMVDGSGTRRRLQALVAVGWSQSRLSERLGVERTNFNKTIRSGMVRCSTARAARRLYDDLWDQPPPENSHREKIAASRARNYARELGWLPPMAWDDEMLDLPDADMKAEIARRVAQMDEDDLRRCHQARYRHGDRTPLVAAAAIEYDRRKRTSRAGAAA